MKQVKQESQHGVVVLIIASLLFAFVSACNRFIPPEIGTFYQLLIKTSIMSIMFLVASVVSKSLAPIEKTDWPLFTLRGILFAADFAAFFIAVNKLPLGTTLFLFYAGSVTLSYLYGYFVLHEKLTKVKIVSLLFAIIGLYIIYADNLNFHSTWIFFALLSGACFGLQTSASKNLSDKYSINQVNLVSYAIATLISLPMLFISKETIPSTISVYGLAIFFIFALLTVLAFYATVYGFKFVEAQKASLLLLGEILFAILIGYFFYKETPPIRTFIGGILIVLSLALPNITFPVGRKNIR